MRRRSSPEFGLPAPEDLQPGDAVDGFLRAGVPEALRRRALRRLWRLNPALANLDALVEYGEDYTDAATVVEKMQTIYQVGSGYRKLFETEASDADGAESEEGAGEEEPDPEAVARNAENAEAHAASKAAERRDEKIHAPTEVVASQPEHKSASVASPGSDQNENHERKQTPLRRMRFEIT